MPSSPRALRRNQIQKQVVDEIEKAAAQGVVSPVYDVLAGIEPSDQAKVEAAKLARKD